MTSLVGLPLFLHPFPFFKAPKKNNLWMSSETKEGSTTSPPASALWCPWDWTRAPPCARSTLSDDEKKKIVATEDASTAPSDEPFEPEPPSTPPKLRKAEAAARKKGSATFHSKDDTDVSLDPVFPVVRRTTPSSSKETKPFPSTAGASGITWDYQYLYPKEKEGNVGCYNVITALAVGNAQASYGPDTWCALLAYQSQLVERVVCFVISQDHPEGEVRFFSPNSAPHARHKAGLQGQDFTALRSLLDGASRIYCFDEHMLYGRLRASPLDIVDLKQIETDAPVNSMDRRSLKNPLIPLPTDPFSNSMSLDIPLIIPEEEDAEEVTRPRNPLPPDPDWKPIVAEKKSAPVPTVKKEASASGASSYNLNDTTEQIAEYEGSERWIGTPNLIKRAAPYFHESQMIFWQLKTFSLVEDLTLSECALSDMIEWNAHQTWWNPNSIYESKEGKTKGRGRAITPGRAPVDFARQGYGRAALFAKGGDGWGPADCSGQVLGQLNYTELVKKKKWDELDAALEWEIRSLADLMTAVHVHKLPITAFVERFNSRTQRYTKTWKRCVFSFCSCSLLSGSQALCAPAPSS
jgi:hypothetical protein